MATTTQNQTKRAVFELRRRIMNGELTGGTRLYEVALAEELDISRTPVREAMSRLAEEGLLERASGRGFMVRSFAYNDVVDAIELRGVLEGTAARLAAERGWEEARMSAVQETLAQLEKSVGSQPENVDFESYYEFNARFHDELGMLCSSEVVQRELDRAKSLPFASPSAFLPDQRALRDFHLSLIVAQSQHRGLVEAILARQGARAEAIAREHAMIARRNLEYILRDAAGAKPASLALLVE
ncbi:GntR family transcriptional regulator [Mesobacterium pallidum]|uniref:GntR family transcriptional regulator n=1 Tax=Mesobacterium pallidum TaxID=2872037 RepID=UPI001EE27B11|nr:GntR family transcriptional regulator [Mesobacterium pallidum]